MCIVIGLLFAQQGDIITDDMQIEVDKLRLQLQEEEQKRNRYRVGS